MLGTVCCPASLCTPLHVGHMILKTMCSLQFVCANRLQKFGCFNRSSLVYLPSMLDKRPEDAKKKYVSLCFGFLASSAFCKFQQYRLRRLC